MNDHYNVKSIFFNKIDMTFFISFPQSWFLLKNEQLIRWAFGPSAELGILICSLLSAFTTLFKCWFIFLYDCIKVAEVNGNR
jgi:hypothetical protein